MELDLKNTELFNENTILLDKKINFIFGKNGTGKSTITKLIIEQSKDKVYIFQGFNSVITEDNKLNAVILGEENKEIYSEIKKEKLKIELEKRKIEQIDKNIEEKGINLKLDEIKKKIEEKEEEIKNFFIRAAREIVNTKIRLVENPRSYNKNTFERDIPYAKTLEAKEILRIEDILKSEKKTTPNFDFPEIDFESYLFETNEILESIVESKTSFVELENNSTKIDFAKKGLEIHSPNEKCAFCGNIISEDRIKNLKKFFLAEDITNAENKIKELKEKITNEIYKINEIKIRKEQFYDFFSEKLIEIEAEINNLQKEQNNFFKKLLNRLNSKSLFERNDKLEIDIPLNYSEIQKKMLQLISEQKEYNENLDKEQEKEREKLKYHYIKDKITTFNLEMKQNEKKELLKKSDDIKQELDKEKIKKEEFDEIINKCKDKILELELKTKSTKKLAENINKKLKKIVSFKLICVEENENREFYKIQDLKGNVREVDKLSTGEKNIISFLYFIEKLNELENISNEQTKIIVFDDPMNSNDDTMQYLIIDELQKLIKKVAKSKLDQFILLTHNIFFYLNLSHELKILRNNTKEAESPYEKNNFYRLLSNLEKTKIIRIKDKNQDFKTNYESLWHELAFLYEEDRAEMMLNPIRRIIETFVIFNGIEDFYKDNKDAKNLFNTNSHYIPDLEVDINGKSKEEIKNIFEKCFQDNNAQNHFNKHWKNANKFLKKIK